MLSGYNQSQIPFWIIKNIKNTVRCKQRNPERGKVSCCIITSCVQVVTRKERQEAAGSSRRAINNCMIRSYYVRVAVPLSSRPPSTAPPRILVLLPPPPPPGLPVSPPHHPHPLHSPCDFWNPPPSVGFDLHEIKIWINGVLEHLLN